mmetsp:Transcript_12552/g.19941  ORF Transcript_12552/g.19941 Transcript_12552/m.19941 type:complete len:392 (+) Transcript_12552:201-1376(+)
MLLSFLDGEPKENFVVVFDDLKRASRDTRAFLELRDAFRLRNTRVECLNFKFDDTPEGEFIETIIAAQGALDRKQNGRQVAQKMKARMEAGYFVHDCPIGYKYVAVRGRGKLLDPNEPFAAIIREAFEGYASGRFQTQAEVKRFFESLPDFPRNKKGVVLQQRVTKILTQPIYTGHICSENYGINWLKAQHEPLISLETYDKVQERRAGAAKAPKRKIIGDDFAMRGLVACACCDVPLRSSFTTGKLGRRYPYYLCQTKDCEAYGKSIKRDQLAADVGAIIKTMQPSQDVMTMAKAIFRHIWEARRNQATDLIRSGQRKIAAIDKEIDKLLGLIMGSSNPTAIQRYEEKISQCEHDKALFTEKLAKQAEPKGSFEEILEPALSFLASPWKL